MDGESTVSDEDLMLNYKAGDAESFNLLYQRYRVSLYNFIYRYCNNNSVTDEVFQDAWTSLINAAESYSVTASFKTYLYRIAHNKLVDYYRKHGSKELISYDENDTYNIETETSSPEEILNNQQRVEQFSELVNELPLAQREAYLLREETGLGLDDIARIMQCNRETVKSRLRYAVTKLKQGLERLHDR